MFHICFLSSMHPPRDKRVFDKEAIALAAAGFKVTHLAPGDGEAWDENRVNLRTYQRPSGLWGRIRQMPLLYALALDVNADSYHCNEVDSWVVGSALKLLHRKKIVFDVHEVYPQEFAESRFPWWCRGLVIGAIRSLFKLLMPVTDRVVFAKLSVAPDFRGWERKQTLVQNFVPVRYLHPERETLQARTPHLGDSPVIAVHLGGISRVKGWPQLVDAMTQTVTASNVKVSIIGAFDGSYDAFLRHVSERNLGRNFRYEKWLPFDEAFQRLLSSHIGLVLLQPGLYNHTHALPHKMFDYMLAGLPVIAPAFAVEVARIVRDADCGILVDTSSADEISNALVTLANNDSERRRLGQNGRRAVLEKYNWEQEAKKLVAMYSELLNCPVV